MAFQSSFSQYCLIDFSFDPQPFERTPLTLRSIYLSFATMVNERLFRSTLARQTSEATSTDTLTDTFQHTEEAQHFLPDNPPIYLTPSFTLQPELLAFHTLLDYLFLLVTRLFEHPITNGPVPASTCFGIAQPTQCSINTTAALLNWAALPCA